MTSTEFIKWIWFLEWRDTEEFNRQDHYLAQIAAEIHRSRVKNPSLVKVKNKLLKFIREDQSKTNAPSTKDSKNYWLGLVGLGKTREPKRERRNKSLGRRGKKWRLG